MASSLWLDRHTNGEDERYSVRRVFLELYNDGNRHRLEFRADFPHDLCADCRLRADIRGNPFRETSWRGEIGVRARSLSINRLPRILRAPLPSGLAGRFDLDLNSQWRNAQPEAVEGQVAVSGLSLPLPGETRPLVVKALNTSLNWKGNTESWRLDLASLRLGLTRPAWLAGRLRLDVQPDRLRVDVEHVDVADLATFTASLPREHVLLDWLRAAQPTGGLNRVRLELTGPITAPTGYSADVGLRNIRFAAHEHVPGVHGLSGQLSLSERQRRVPPGQRRNARGIAANFEATPDGAASVKSHSLAAESGRLVCAGAGDCAERAVMAAYAAVSNCVFPKTRPSRRCSSCTPISATVMAATLRVISR